MQRRDKTNYYLDIAETVAKRSTCLRRHYGAVIVNHDEIGVHGIRRRAQGPKKLFRSEPLCSYGTRDSPRTAI